MSYEKLEIFKVSGISVFSALVSFICLTGAANANGHVQLLGTAVVIGVIYAFISLVTFACATAFIYKNLPSQKRKQQERKAELLRQNGLNPDDFGI